MCIRDSHRMTTKEVACLAYGIDHVPGDQSEFIKLKTVSYTHLDVYKRQTTVW